MSDVPNDQKRYSPKTSPFLNEVRNVLRLKHMSRHTETSYVYYILDFIRFHGKRHPNEMGSRKSGLTYPTWLPRTTWRPLPRT